MTRTTPVSVQTLGTGELQRNGSCSFQKNRNVAPSSGTMPFLAYFGRGQPSHGEKMAAYADAASVASALRKDSNVTAATDLDDSERSAEAAPAAAAAAAGDEDGYNPGTDLSCHSDAERDGCDQIRAALTEDELDSLADDYMPLRHFRAEKGDVAKATAAIKETLRWRREFQVDAIIRAFEDGGSGGMADIIAKENETGKIYCRGFDAQGRCLLLMRPGRENTMREDDNMRHLVFQLEKAIACSAKNGQGKLCLVIDYDGFTLAKSPPLATSKRTLDILQRHYCERMHRAYVCNPPFVFRSFWAIIKPFVDPVTKEKVCFCVGKKGFAKIADDLGGTDPAHRQLEKCASGVETVRDFDSKEYLGLPFHVAFDEEARLE